jgi:hypothetical protein
VTTDPAAAASAGLDVSAQLSVNLGRVAAALETERRDRQAVADNEPRYIKAPAAYGVVPASGVLTLSLSGPKTGYQWTIRRITITDASVASASVGGSAQGYIYAGAITGVTNVQPENLEWIMPVLPNVATFGSDQIVLQYTEHLYCQLTGGTEGQAIKMSVAYQLYRAGGARRQVQV